MDGRTDGWTDGQSANLKCPLASPVVTKKEKMMVTCLQNKSYVNTVGKQKIVHNKQFPLFQSVFYPFEMLSAFFIKFEIVICKLFQFGRV